MSAWSCTEYSYATGLAEKPIPIMSGAITVNRWPHGYAPEYNSLFDPDWPEGEQPWVQGRKPFGKIAIANSDAGASAYTDAAIDQAYRAIQELRKQG